MPADNISAAAHQEEFHLLANLAATAADDRTLAIVCAAYCEKFAAILVQGKMPGLNAGLRKTLFEGDGALSTASARFHLAKALGLIDQSFYDGLRRVAAIRNLFAHNLEITTFDHPLIVKEMDRITLAPVEATTGEPWSRWETLRRRQKFNWIGVTLAMSLSNALNASSR